MDTPASAKQRLNPPEIRLSLLGAFNLAWRSSPIRVPLSAQPLLAFLALRRRRRLLRSYVAGVLWPDTCESRAVARLRSELWRIRRVCPPAITATPQLVTLGPDVVVDVDEMAVDARALIEGEQRSVSRAALAKLEAELLPDWYDDWLSPDRQRLRELQLQALEAMAELLVASGSTGQAVEAALVAVTGDPLRESARRALIRAHLAHGNAADAIREYRSFRTLLRKDLGLEPSAQMKALVRGLSP